MSVVKSTVSTDQIGLGGKVSSLPASNGIAKKGCVLFLDWLHFPKLSFLTLDRLLMDAVEQFFHEFFAQLFFDSLFSSGIHHLFPSIGLKYGQVAGSLVGPNLVNNRKAFL